MAVAAKGNSGTAATTPTTPLWTLDDVATYLSVCRRTTERMLATGKLPKPDVRLGKLMRWKPETIFAWLNRRAEAN